MEELDYVANENVNSTVLRLAHWKYVLITIETQNISARWLQDRKKWHIRHVNVIGVRRDREDWSCLSVLSHCYKYTYYLLFGSKQSRVRREQAHISKQLLQLFLTLIDNTSSIGVFACSLIIYMLCLVVECAGLSK